VSFNINCDFVWFRFNRIYRECSKFRWLIWERKIVFQHSMFFYKLDTAENDVICMQMTFLNISMNVFCCESAKTDKIDKKTRSKNKVKQSNVNRITWFFDNNMNCIILLDKINCFLDSQLIVEIDETIELKSRWIIANMNIWHAVQNSAVQQFVRDRIDCERRRHRKKWIRRIFIFDVIRIFRFVRFFFLIRCLRVLFEYAIDDELDLINYFSNVDLDYLNNRRIRFSIRFSNAESNIKTFHITRKHFAQTVRIFLFVRFDYD
jgi:hypothetical protein